MPEVLPVVSALKGKEEQRGRQMYTHTNTRLCQEGRRDRNGHLENALLCGIYTHTYNL